MAEADAALASMRLATLFTNCMLAVCPPPPPAPAPHAESAMTGGALAMNRRLVDDVGSLLLLLLLWSVKLADGREALALSELTLAYDAAVVAFEQRRLDVERRALG